MLRNEGYEAEGFGSGKAALDKLAEFDPDVIISDIAMPSITGWDVAKAVRGNRRPVLIAISAQYTLGADKVLAQIKGFNYYLVSHATRTCCCPLSGRWQLISASPERPGKVKVTIRARHEVVRREAPRA